MSHARVREQVLDERVHALAALAGEAPAARAAFARQRRAVAALEQREEAGDRGQRLAQVVRDDRGEALELGVGALELGRALDRARPLAARAAASASSRSVTSMRRQVDERLLAVRRPRRCSATSGSRRPCRARGPRPAATRRAACARAARRTRHLGPVLRVHELQVRALVELGRRPARRALPGGVDPAQVPSASAAPSRSCERAKRRSAWAASADVGARRTLRSGSTAGEDPGESSTRGQ